MKDNIDTAAIRTTVGSAFFKSRVPDSDADVVRRLRDAGAVVLGKLSMHEFAYGATGQNPHYGEGRNPWDLDRIPGGSSGGSAAAVAAGLCAAALGTDTGGSVRTPAALNGVSGLRPSTGRVSNAGVFPITWTFDTVGPLARTVPDLAAMLSVLAGYDASDPGSSDRPVADYSQAVAGGIDAHIRIGVPRNFFFDGVDPDVASRVLDAAKLLGQVGASVEEVYLPGVERADDVTTRMIWAEAYAIHRSRLEEGPTYLARTSVAGSPLDATCRAPIMLNSASKRGSGRGLSTLCSVTLILS